MRSLAVLLIVLLAGCASSPPTRFYTLDPVRPVQPSPKGVPLVLQVAAVHIPGVLDRQEMVRERAPGRLQVSDRHRWGAPLAEMIRRVLAQDLLARLPGSMLLAPRELPSGSARVLVLDVLRFAAGPAGRVRLQGSWSVFAGRAAQPFLSAGADLASRRTVSGFAGQANAMSRLLGRLADRIAGSLAAHAPPRARAGEPEAPRTTRN